MRIAQYFQVDKRLKFFRRAAHISQKRMAAKLELPVPTYSNYENGYSEPSMEVIQKFCSIIGIKEKSFFFCNDECFESQNTGRSDKNIGFSKKEVGDV